MPQTSLHARVWVSRFANCCCGVCTINNYHLLLLWPLVFGWLSFWQFRCQEWKTKRAPRDSAQTAKKCRCPQSLRGFLLPPQNFKLSLSRFLALRSSCAQLLSVSATLSGFHFPLLQLLSHPFCSKGETRDSQDLEQLLGTWAPHS